MIDLKVIDEMLQEIETEIANNERISAEIMRQIGNVEIDEKSMQEVQARVQEAQIEAQKAGKERAEAARSRMNMSDCVKTTHLGSKRARSFI